MDRTSALDRLQAISCRRVLLLVELTELQAEETQLRKFFRLQKTTAVMEALSPVAAEAPPLAVLVPVAAAALPAEIAEPPLVAVLARARGRGRGRGKVASEEYCPGCRYDKTPSRGAHLWREPCLRTDPPPAARRRLEARAAAELLQARAADAEVPAQAAVGDGSGSD